MTKYQNHSASLMCELFTFLPFTKILTWNNLAKLSTIFVETFYELTTYSSFFKNDGLRGISYNKLSDVISRIKLKILATNRTKTATIQ